MNRQELQDAIDKQHAEWQRLARMGSPARISAFKKLQALEMAADQMDAYVAANK